LIAAVAALAPWLGRTSRWLRKIAPKATKPEKAVERPAGHLPWQNRQAR